MENELIDFLKEIIKENYNILFEGIKLELPPKKEFGDYSFGGFLLAKDLKKSPNLIVLELKEIIDSKISQDFFISKVSIEGPYLNITLNNKIYTDLLKKLDLNISSLEKYGKGKTIFVDYIGTNVGKPLHIGHMCTPNQGQTIINVYRKLGYDVISDSHIGDWGIIFGKLITAYKLYGDEQKLKENAVEHLFDLYVRITEEVEKDNYNLRSTARNIKEYFKIDGSLPIDFEEINTKNNYLILERALNSIKDKGIKEYWLKIYNENFKNLEQKTRDEFKALSEGNPESVKLWESFTKESIKSMNTQLNRLNVKPDFNIGESFYEGLKNLPKIENFPDLEFNMNSIVSELIEKGIATKNEDGSVGVIFPEDSKIPSCILQKRDGTNLYFTSDLCAIKYRTLNWKLDKIIYFVDVRQQLHFKQAFEIAKMAGWLKKDNGENMELFHAYNGFITLQDGAMSTRKGRIIKLDKLLDEAENRAKNIILEKRTDLSFEELQNLSRIIGIGAIKYGYLKKSRETDVIFDWDEFMTFEGNSGPYIQYAFVRANNIIKTSNMDTSSLSLSGFFTGVDEIELIKELLNYENILLETSKYYMPHILASYCYNLTKKFNTFYNSTHILSEIDENIKNNRLILVSKFRDVLKDGFNLLGIEIPEKM